MGGATAEKHPLNPTRRRLVLPVTYNVRLFRQGTACVEKKPPHKSALAFNMFGKRKKNGVCPILQALKQPLFKCDAHRCTQTCTQMLPIPQRTVSTVRSLCIDHSVDWPHPIDQPARVVDAAASQRHSSPPPPSTHKHKRVRAHADTPNWFPLHPPYIHPPSVSIVFLFLCGASSSFLPPSCSSLPSSPILSQTMCMSHLPSGKDVGFSVEPASGPETFTHCPLAVNMWITPQLLGARQLDPWEVNDTNMSRIV